MKGGRREGIGWEMGVRVGRDWVKGKRWAGLREEEGDWVKERERANGRGGIQWEEPHWGTRGSWGGGAIGLNGDNKGGDGGDIGGVGSFWGP